MWDAFAKDRRRRHDKEVAGLNTRIEELEGELADRPEKIVHRYVDLDELQDAQTEAHRAFASRENAWRALCEIWVLHHERDSGRCQCGQPMDRCKTAQIVDHYPAFEKWNREQIQRFRSGRDHMLPTRHPAVIDPRWQP